MKLTKILVPLDGSALAETAIPTAVQFAKEQGAAVVLLRAAEAPWIHGEDIADVQVHIVRDAEKYLDELAVLPPHRRRPRRLARGMPRPHRSGPVTKGEWQ